MAILIDTNILLRLLQPHHPHCSLAERALGTLRTRNETLNVAPQNLMEFWAVATRPTSENGLGLAVETAAGELRRFPAAVHPRGRKSFCLPGMGALGFHAPCFRQEYA